jgi:hypothetical protein
MIFYCRGKVITTVPLKCIGPRLHVQILKVLSFVFLNSLEAILGYEAVDAVTGQLFRRIVRNHVPL